MPCPLAQLADIPVVEHDSSSTLASACFRPLYMMSCYGEEAQVRLFCVLQSVQ
jgi:hypothetical protein